MIGVELDGLLALIASLQKAEMSDRYRSAGYLVGYGGSPPSEDYAVYVHENLPSKYAGRRVYSRPGTGPKFLEAPLRRMAQTYSRDLIELMRGGRSLRQAIHSKAEMLKQDSLQEVPVDEGYLEASAVVRGLD